VLLAKMSLNVSHELSSPDVERPMKMNTDITIRDSRPADEPALRKLAALDSKTLPSGELIVAEISGEVVAAYSPERASAIADPFRRTADVVDLLRVRATGLRPEPAKIRHGLLPRAA
jgi:hypothetical protein